MTTAFLSLSFADRHTLTAEIEALRQLLAQNKIELFLFIERYHFEPEQAVEMMATACADIAAADFLIAEVTYKAIGVGVEVGYAAALGKPIVYIRHADAEPSTTVGGMADLALVYQNALDLAQQLQPHLPQLLEAIE